MRISLCPVLATALLAITAGCTSGNSAREPGFTSVPLTQNQLQFAVGVATFSDASKGLNVVETFRQPDGLSGTLLNTPTLTGPFTVPAGSGGVDGGTHTISGSPQAIPGSAPAIKSTFGQSGGAFAYGFAPENSTTGGAANYALYSAPFYGDGSLTSSSAPSGAVTDSPSAFDAFRGGPPAYPNVRGGTFPSGFLGYTLGFTTFALAPVAGAYALSVNIPSGNSAGATITAPAAKLSSTAGLPAFAAAPAFTEDGAGGGTATCAPPPGTTETLVEIEDTMVGSFYTVLAQGGGAVTATLPPLLGPTISGTAPSIASGDAYQVVCIAADYPLFEAGPPQNTQQLPALTGAAGQDDLAFSAALTGTYGAAPATAIRRRR